MVVPLMRYHPVFILLFDVALGALDCVFKGGTSADTHCAKASLAGMGELHLMGVPAIGSKFLKKMKKKNESTKLLC